MIIRITILAILFAFSVSFNSDYSANQYKKIQIGLVSDYAIEINNINTFSFEEIETSLDYKITNFVFKSDYG